MFAVNVLLHQLHGVCGIYTETFIVNEIMNE